MISDTRLAVFSIISFVISFLIFPVIIKVFKQLKWFEAPAGHKIHSEFVPSMGGVAILVGASLALLMTLPLNQWISMKYFFISIATMFMIGLRDDVLALSPRQKLVSQFLPVFVLVFLDRAILTSLYGMGSHEAFPILVSYAVSVFSVIIVTNAYNLIDGIDGLAGTIGCLTLAVFGAWFYVAGNTFLCLIAWCFASSLIAFLVFNWQPSKIFMGDTGALTIGLILSFFAIRFINVNDQLSSDHVAKFNATITTAVCVLIVPIFDTLRVIILRLRRFQSPFHADRNHLHHQFLSLGLSHAATVKWIAGINVFFVGLAILFKNQGDFVLLPIVLSICLVINFGLKRRLRTRGTVDHAQTS